MMKRLRTGIVTCVLLFIFATGLHAADPSTTLLTILHVNDYHGRIDAAINKDIDSQKPVGGAAYLAAVIDKERAGNPAGTLLLAAGDMFQGSPVSNIYHGAPVLEIMNELRFDAMALGNHDFDWGVPVLQRLRKEAHFPFLAANIVDNYGNLLPGIRPYSLLRKKHITIAVIGLTTPETVYTTKPGNVKGLTFLSPETVLPRLIQNVKQRGASIVIVLSHLGLNADRRLAEAVPGIDVIVGGHSHTAIQKPLKIKSGVDLYRKSGENLSGKHVERHGKRATRATVIVQAGAYGIYLGVLELTVDKATGRTTGYTDRSGLEVIAAGPENALDNKTALIVKKHAAKVKGKFAAVTGETSIDLTGQRESESNLGDFATDAMRAAAQSEIAFYNSGGIRATIPAGTITMEELYTAFPFDNVLVTMNLTGEQVRRTLEQAGSMEFGGLQMSGITVTYDLKRAVGERVVKARVGTEPLSADRVYTVVTNDFLAAGGDKMSALTEGKNITYGITLIEALVNYLKEESPVSPKVEGRIRFAE